MQKIMSVHHSDWDFALILEADKSSSVEKYHFIITICTKVIMNSSSEESSSILSNLKRFIDDMLNDFFSKMIHSGRWYVFLRNAVSERLNQVLNLTLNNHNPSAFIDWTISFWADNAQVDIWIKDN